MMRPVCIGWSKVGDLEFAKVVKDSDAILKLSRCVVIDDTMQWHVQVHCAQVTTQQVEYVFLL